MPSQATLQVKGKNVPGWSNYTVLAENLSTNDFKDKGWQAGEHYYGCDNPVTPYTIEFQPTSLQQAKCQLLYIKDTLNSLSGTPASGTVSKNLPPAKKVAAAAAAAANQLKGKAENGGDKVANAINNAAQNDPNNPAAALKFGQTAAKGLTGDAAKGAKTVLAAAQAAAQAAANPSGTSATSGASGTASGTVSAPPVLHSTGSGTASGTVSTGSAPPPAANPSGTAPSDPSAPPPPAANPPPAAVKEKDKKPPSVEEAARTLAASAPSAPSSQNATLSSPESSTWSNAIQITSEWLLKPEVQEYLARPNSQHLTPLKNEDFYFQKGNEHIYVRKEYKDIDLNEILEKAKDTLKTDEGKLWTPVISEYWSRPNNQDDPYLTFTFTKEGKTKDAHPDRPDSLQTGSNQYLQYHFTTANGNQKGFNFCSNPGGGTCLHETSITSGGRRKHKTQRKRPSKTHKKHYKKTKSSKRRKALTSKRR